eukprot:SAG31_NODE_260_length_18915_cov_3.432823_5_plen_168_part_00
MYLVLHLQPCTYLADAVSQCTTHPHQFGPRLVGLPALHSCLLRTPMAFRPMAHRREVQPALPAGCDHIPVHGAQREYNDRRQVKKRCIICITVAAVVNEPQTIPLDRSRHSAKLVFSAASGKHIANYWRLRLRYRNVSVSRLRARNPSPAAADVRMSRNSTSPIAGT